MLKLSSLASVIGFPDLTRKANELVVSVYRPLEIYSALIVEYLVLVLAISAAIRWLERRMSGTHRDAPVAVRGGTWLSRRLRLE